MVCGYDAYHDSKQTRAVGAFIASMNTSFTRFISMAAKNEANSDISANFYHFVMKALRLDESS